MTAKWLACRHQGYGPKAGSIPSYQLRILAKTRLAASCLAVRARLDLATEPNCCWALDFMHDARYCGRLFRTLNVIDEANRESRIKTPLSSGSIALIALKRLMHICSPTVSRFKQLPTDGWSITTSTAHTNRWAAYRRCNSCLD